MRRWAGKTGTKQRRVNDLRDLVREAGILTLLSVRVSSYVVFINNVEEGSLHFAFSSQYLNKKIHLLSRKS